MSSNRASKDSKDRDEGDRAKKPHEGHHIQTKIDHSHHKSIVGTNESGAKLDDSDLQGGSFETNRVFEEREGDDNKTAARSKQVFKSKKDKDQDDDDLIIWGKLSQDKGLEVLNATLPKDLQLSFPQGLVQKPINIKLKQPEGFDPLISGKATPFDAKTSQNSNLTKDKLLGLPGQFSLDEKTTRNYFGDTAKDNFYDRYHYLSRQNEIKLHPSASLSDIRNTFKNSSHFNAFNTTSNLSPAELELAVPNYSIKDTMHSAVAENMFDMRGDANKLKDSHVNEPNNFSFAPRRQELYDEEVNFLHFDNTRRSEIHASQSHPLLLTFDEFKKKEKEENERKEKIEKENQKIMRQQQLALEKSEAVIKAREAKAKEKADAKKLAKNPSFFVPLKIEEKTEVTPSSINTKFETVGKLNHLILGKKEGWVPRIKEVKEANETKEVTSTTTTTTTTSIVAAAAQIAPKQMQDSASNNQIDKKKGKKLPKNMSSESLNSINKRSRPATASASSSNTAKVINSATVAKGDVESAKDVTHRPSIAKDAGIDHRRRKNLPEIEHFKSSFTEKDQSKSNQNKLNNLVKDDDNRSLSSMSDILGLSTRVIPGSTPLVDNNPYFADFYEPASPRSKFIEACIRDKVVPRSSLVLRKKFTKELNMSRQAMGDDNAIRLAEAITSIPYIESIHLADNRLTDRGLVPILKNLCQMTNLLELDLSENDVDTLSAKYLSKYLKDPRCSLEKLIMKSADVDDMEASRFISAIKACKTLREIDLSNNKIGSAENLNTVMPDLVTGGEALADLIRSQKCTITILNLQWNMIRLNGAIELASSLASNKSLTYLNLSYNSLGKNGGVALGSGLIENCTLRKLYLDDNALDSEASFTICAGALENKSLEFLSLDGNPIGDLGSRALMLIPAAIGYRLTTSSLRCNINIKDASSFSFIRVLRDYHLNMENPFERAMVIVLNNIISGHHTYSIRNMTHEVTFPNGKSKKTKIELDYAIDVERMSEFNEEQNKRIAILRRLLKSSTDISLAVSLFNEYDKDSSGQLDKFEFRCVLSDLGIEMTDKRFEEIMNQYDTDRQGLIEISEFLQFLKEKASETKSKIKDIMEVPIIVEKGKRNKNGNALKFIPPKFGELHFTVYDTFSTKKYFRTLTATDKTFIEDMAKKSGGELLTMIGSGLSGTKLRLDEALSLSRLLAHEIRDVVKILQKLLPQMSDVEDARKLFASVCNYNRTIMSTVRRDLGPVARSLLGYYNAFYRLDLKVDMDRLCLIQLLEVSKNRLDEHQIVNDPYLINVGDTSQSGNWTSFRNEIFDGRPIIIDSKFANPLPAKGIVEFDFIYARRPDPGELPISDSKFLKLLVKYFLLPRSLEEKTQAQLKKVNTLLEKTAICYGDLVHVCNEKRALKISEVVDEFYANTVHRASQIFADNDHFLISKQERPDIVTTKTTTSLTSAEVAAAMAAGDPKHETQQFLLPKSIIKSRESEQVLVERFFDMIHTHAIILPPPAIHPQVGKLDLNKLFKVYDKNSDGSLDYNEMANIVMTIGLPVSEETIKAVFCYFDKTKNGKILMSEFIYGFFNKRAFLKKIQSQMKLNSGSKVVTLDSAFKLHLFQDYDKNKNGNLSKVEFKKYIVDCCPDVSDSEIEFLFLETDLNKNKSISIEEFISFINKEMYKLLDTERRQYQGGVDNLNKTDTSGGNDNKDSKDDNLKDIRGNRDSKDDSRKDSKESVHHSPYDIQDKLHTEQDPIFEDSKDPQVLDFDLYDGGGFEFAQKLQEYRKKKAAFEKEKSTRLAQLAKTAPRFRAAVSLQVIQREEQIEKDLSQFEVEMNERCNGLDNNDLTFFNLYSDNSLKSLNTMGESTNNEEYDDDSSSSSSSSNDSDTQEVGDIATLSLISDSSSSSEEVSDVEDEDDVNIDTISMGESDTDSIIEAKIQEKKRMIVLTTQMKAIKRGEKREKRRLKDMVRKDRERLIELQRNAMQRRKTEKENRKKFLKEQMDLLVSGELTDINTIETLMSQLSDVDENCAEDSDKDDSGKTNFWSGLTDAEVDAKKEDEVKAEAGKVAMHSNFLASTEVVKGIGFGSSIQRAKLLEKFRYKLSEIKLGRDAEDSEKLYLNETVNICSINEARNVLTKLSVTYAEPDKSDPFLVHFHEMICNPLTPVLSISSRYVEILEELLGSHWIRCSHLLLLLEYFKTIGKLKTSRRFSTFRVELIISVFNRIFDLQNFNVILRSLSAFEVGCIIARIGYLNFWNPIRPEGAICLNLSRRDERVVCKILCALAVNEPGDNWLSKRFRWTLEDEYMPGWELTQPWLQEEGIPIRGLLELVYYSGEGKGKRGCRPNIHFRKSLTYLVLLEESDLQDSCENVVPKEKRDGFVHMKGNAVLFGNYLAPMRVDKNRTR